MPDPTPYPPPAFFLLDQLADANRIVREGRANHHSDIAIMRAKILLEQAAIVANRPHPPGMAYCTPTLDERREKVLFLYAEIARISQVSA